MGKALQLVSGFVPTPSTSFIAATPSGSDLFAVNDYADGSKAWMFNAWADLAGGGALRMRSPNFHDDVNGIELIAPAAQPIALMDGHSKQILQSNDTVTYELADLSQTTAAGFSALHYYENLPGSDAQLFRYVEIEHLIAELMTCRVALTVSGTRGQYVAQIGMTALQNLFKANGYYALLGYQTSKSYQTVGVTGTDTSNRRVGGPGATPGIFDTREWFIQQSEQSGLPCVPVYKTQNLQSTVVDVIDSQNVGSGTIEFTFARLSQPVAA